MDDDTPPNSMNDDPIEFRTADGVSLIRPFGDAVFLNALKVKAFAKEMTSAGIHMFHLDLAYCTKMDSTFLGTITALALLLREKGSGKVCILNCPAEIRKLIETLGLDDFLHLDPSP